MARTKGTVEGPLFSEEPERDFMAAVLLQSVEDYRRLCLGQVCRDVALEAKLAGYNSPVAELRDFFDSAWCQNMCDWIDLDHRVFRAKVLARREGDVGP